MPHPLPWGSVRAGRVTLVPLLPSLYLRAWVLVGPEGSVAHDDPILVQGERKGLWPPQPSPPGRVLDLRNALSDQRVQILNVLQDQIKIDLVFANNGFTCGRGIRVTGEGVVAQQVYLYGFEVCLSPDICGLPVLCPSRVCSVGCNLCCGSAPPGPRGRVPNHKGRAGAASSGLQSSSRAAPGAQAQLLGSLILSGMLCWAG